MKTPKSFHKLVYRAVPALLLGILLTLVFVSGPAQAERSFDITQINVNAEILPDATMQVTEYISIDFTGQWNGFFRTIPKDYSHIVEVVVFENGKAYSFNPTAEYGPPGTYLVQDQGDSVLIDWSIDALDESRTFAISYRVLNAVKIHNDAAELYRKFIGEENQQKIDQVNVNLRLPAGAETYEQGKDIRIWGHGPLNGEVDFAGANEVVWQVSNLPPETFVEGRVVLPPALFPDAPQNVRTNETALDSILAEEEAWAREANQSRWLARGQIGAALSAVLGALGWIFLLWRKYGRSHPVSFDGEYFRELPANYSPGELSSLWNYKSIKTQDLTATILDLARRKFVRIDQEIIEKDRFLFGTKEEEAYRLTFLDAPDAGSLRKPEEAVLRPHEQELLTYLADTVAGGKGYLYLHEIEEYAKDHSKKFYKFWQGWSEGLNLRGEDLNFFDSNGSMITKTILTGITLFILAGVSLGKFPILAAGLLVAGILIVIIPLFFKRRSVSGEEDYVRWQAFRRFLLDFSQMEQHEIPSLVIWEHYLVFAVTLGVAKEVIKQLELVFPNMQEGDHRFGHGWYYYGTHAHFASLHHSFDAISDSFNNSVKTAQAAVSKTSSGSGGGGGFSGGGGGGGGGGGFGGR